MGKERKTEELYSEYAREMLAYSISLLKNYDDARDAVQEVFLRFIKTKDSFKGECSYKTWLMILTRNYCYTKLKSRNPNLRDLDEALFRQEEMNIEIKMSVNDALEKLHPVEKELIYLSIYAGYSYREIAEILGISVNSVGIKLFRLRKEMKEYLK